MPFFHDVTWSHGLIGIFLLHQRESCYIPSERNLQAKRNAKRTVYTAKKTAEEKKFSDLKPGMDDIFKIAKQLRKDNQDVVGDKCVKDDSGNLSFHNEAKKVAWKQHYERLLNEEFSWIPEDLTADPVVGPPIHIDVEMVVKAITKMKTGKAAGPSGIVAEMLKASGDTGARLVADLANDMVRNGVIPSDWEDSFIINIYKGKGDALERGNYRGLKLLDHVMKGMERVIEKIIRERISIDDMQFGFMPGRGTTDAIFILRQLQEKHLAKNKKLYFAFVDLEKAFNRVPRKVIWWAMRKLGIEEWIVRFVQAMYNNTRSRVRVNNTYSDEFGVKVGVHQGSVLSPLLFVIVLKALSCEFRTGTPWELLYADDLVISAETEEGLKMKLNKWKTEMEAKGLRVNMGKTKIMVSGVNLQTLKDSGEYPCSVCRKGVGSNSIYCAGCSHWVHKKCSGVTGSLKSNPDYRCSRCKGTARPIDGRPHNEWLLMQDKNWMLLIHSATLEICKVAKIRFRTEGKRGRPKNANDDPSPVMPNIKICSNCFSIIGKGLSHFCSSKRAKVDNIQKLLHTMPTSSQRVASQIIKDSATPLLSTLGKPLPVNDFQIIKKTIVFCRKYEYDPERPKSKQSQSFDFGRGP